MNVTVSFYSYVKEITGCSQTMVGIPDSSTMDELLQTLGARYPRLVPINHSLLTAVGVEYQGRGYRLQPGDEVSIFPPVQGG